MSPALSLNICLSRFGCYNLQSIIMAFMKANVWARTRKLVLEENNAKFIEAVRLSLPLANSVEEFHLINRWGSPVIAAAPFNEQLRNLIQLKLSQ